MLLVFLPAIAWPLYSLILIFFFEGGQLVNILLFRFLSLTIFTFQSMGLKLFEFLII